MINLQVLQRCRIEIWYETIEWAWKRWSRHHKNPKFWIPLHRVLKKAHNKVNRKWAFVTKHRATLGHFSIDELKEIVAELELKPFGEVQIKKIGDIVFHYRLNEDIDDTQEYDTATFTVAIE